MAHADRDAVLATRSRGGADAARARLPSGAGRDLRSCSTRASTCRSAPCTACSTNACDAAALRHPAYQRGSMWPGTRQDGAIRRWGGRCRECTSSVAMRHNAAVIRTGQPRGVFLWRSRRDPIAYRPHISRYPSPSIRYSVPAGRSVQDGTDGRQDTRQARGGECVRR